MARILFRGTLLAAAAAATLGYSGLAQAHFNLKEPANWMTQADNGDPQKTGPCGAAMEQGKTFMASGIVTPFKAGETIAITIDETVTHPGHYRVALAVTDRSELPAEPAVTPGSMACGTAAVMDPPVFPILADGVLDHTAAFDGPQTIMVKLPDDVTCDKCTLQVLEFMSAHGSPCFYHHCADISITSDGNGGMSAGGASAGGAPSAGTGNSAAGMLSIGGALGMSGGPASSGMGGTPGQAGTSPLTSGSAGMLGAGGAAGSGGTAVSMGGTSQTALGGSGGTTTGAAGTSAPHAGTTSTPVAPSGAQPASDEAGGCSTSPGRSSTPTALASLLALAWLRARRRRA